MSLTKQQSDGRAICLRNCPLWFSPPKPTLRLVVLQVAAFAEHTKRIWSVDFSATDPQRFLSGSDDGTVRLWSINDQVRSCCSWELQHPNLRGRRHKG